MKDIKTIVNTIGFQLKKHSPEILMVAGVVGTVTATVMACKATTKINDILDKTKCDLDVIHAAAKDENLKDRYSEEDARKDTAIVYAQTGMKFVKLYAPSVLLGTASLASMIGSNAILKKRNVALAAAYATIDKTFKKYRSNVVERFGEKVDKELRYSIKAKEIEETVTDEKGKEKTKKTTVDVSEFDPNQYSDYAKIFDESNPYWEKDSEFNMSFLKSQQSFANNMLRARGRLFLNDVYKMLGFEPTKAGQVVGWVYDTVNPSGDNFVDFGIFDINRARARDFVNGYERSIVLDFNVDGNIWENM